MTEKSTFTYSVAILAGGQSRRMGRNKALILFDGKPVLQHVIDAVRPLTDDLFLVANDPATYADFNLPIHPDALPGKGALGGIYTAIERARYDWVFVVACDMPFLNPVVIAALAGRQSVADVDVVIPRVQNRPETLHAFYRKQCLPAIKAQLDADQLKVTNFFPAVTVDYVSAEELESLAGGLDSFRNLNTPDDLRLARRAIRKVK